MVEIWHIIRSFASPGRPNSWLLLMELVRRDFTSRYQGSVLGVAWSLLTPLLMLGTYTFVFSVAFRARWGSDPDGNIAFAVVLFSGMIVHGFFAECFTRAPLAITSHPNFVKKVIFPLELIPQVILITALMQLALNFCILILFCLLSGTPIQLGVLLTPIILLPLVVLTLGVIYLLASLGVFFRDLAHGVGMVATVLMFLGPVFYSTDMLPTAIQNWLFLNPISLPIIQFRDAMLWGQPVDWFAWLTYAAFALASLFFGYWWFEKTRRGFADVL